MDVKTQVENVEEEIDKTVKRRINSNFVHFYLLIFNYFSLTALFDPNPTMYTQDLHNNASIIHRKNGLIVDGSWDMCK